MTSSTLAEGFVRSLVAPTIHSPRLIHGLVLHCTYISPWLIPFHTRLQSSAFSSLFVFIELCPGNRGPQLRGTMFRRGTCGQAPLIPGSERLYSNLFITQPSDITLFYGLSYFKFNLCIPLFQLPLSYKCNKWRLAPSEPSALTCRN